MVELDDDEEMAQEQVCLITITLPYVESEGDIERECDLYVMCMY